MNWINDLFGTSLSNGALLTIVFVTLLVLLVLFVWLLRKVFGHRINTTTLSRKPRLTVTDAAIVDDKRRLVLVKRDEIEHLVMIGGPSDIVIEQNIVRTAEQQEAIAAAMRETAPEAKPVVQKPAEEKPVTAPEVTAQKAAPETLASPAPQAAAAVTGAATVSTASAAGSGTNGAASYGDDGVSAHLASAKNTAAEISADATAKTSEASSQVAERLARIEEYSTRPADSISADKKPDIETVKAESSDIMDRLDSALEMDDEISSSTAPEVTLDTPADPPANPSAQKTTQDDDMQKLLQELELETSRS